SVLALAVAALPAQAQVTEVTVGVTPSCPYGISGCWAGAYEALGRLQGVESVGKAPDAYNCTAHLYLQAKGLPDVERWPQQFESVVGKTYVFRGVEAALKGSVEDQAGKLLLRVPGLQQSVTLAPLHHKLQWNFKKGSARQPEPDERDAYDQLAAKKTSAKESAFGVEVTGPLRRSGKGFIVEVREVFLIPLEANPG